MIIYHPYKDANHCVYRILSILTACNQPVNLNYLHIADFYHLFPCQLKNIEKWPSKNSSNYKYIQNIQDAYENIENPRKIFFELKTIQRNIIINLLSRNIIEYTKDDLIKIKNIPKSIYNLMNEDIFRKTKEFEIITKNMKALNLYGTSGLKSKSGLMEYRYDLPKIKD
ncbi:ABC-three component system middle component 5 [Photobacterium phosphoreum]|uniref:ABC-three component system middle component 5 n=1 Tax=Photobacterium phosphoreum TaxID=659 RepID=UPI0005D3BF7A|nr:ABC-three component system middle component 5 [Photobacterium phosphoreum]KJF86993.1 hypothetical protein UB41_08895 [Photobacterium phosphoreum]MCD9480409.1 hypothetical protein [Photobacterium phosphoreum]PQJ91186.1 hypothetical protein BTO21_05500 [Photobacterium phosphoreum]PSU40157.1 hypothetical protein CTM85_04300 [Photobacterium phosphoreum]PSV70235.1 hypothetical protein CTM77_12775 [Photobacterium phosphoreum]